MIYNIYACECVCGMGNLIGLRPTNPLNDQMFHSSFFLIFKESPPWNFEINAGAEEFVTRSQGASDLELESLGTAFFRFLRIGIAVVWS